MKNLNPAWVSITISILAFFISYLTYRSAKVKIKIIVSEDIDVFPNKALYLKTDGNKIYPMGPGIRTSIEFVNYGTKDVSFFRLNLLKKHSENETLLLKSLLPESNSSKTFELNLINKSGVEQLHIPEQHYGVIPAHGYKKFDIVITNISPNTEFLTMLFILSKTPSFESRLNHLLMAHSKRKLKVIGRSKFENYPLLFEIPEFSKDLVKSENELKDKIEKTYKNIADHGTPY